RRIYRLACPDAYRASPSVAGLPHRVGLVSGSCSSSPSSGLSFLQIPPHDGHPCLASRFRSSRPAEDLHLRESQHAWRTTWIGGPASRTPIHLHYAGLGIMRSRPRPTRWPPTRKPSPTPHNSVRGCRGTPAVSPSAGTGPVLG